MTRKRPRYGYVPQQEEAAQQAEPEVIAQQAEPGDVAGAAHALKNPDAYALPPQRKGKRAEEGVARRTDIQREQLNVRIRPELKRAAAARAALEGKTLGDVVEAALIRYLKAAQADLE